MNKTEYLDSLRKELKRLPKNEYDEAIDYFEEYFEDAGEENMAQAIEDLGTPQEAAEQIIRELASNMDRAQEAKKDVKKGFSGVWIVILAILASPIAMPIAVALICVLFALLIVVLSVLLALGVTGLGLAITAPVALVGAFTMITKSFPVFLTCLGMSLTGLTAGVLIIYGTFLLVRRFLYWIVVVFGKMFSKGGKKDEEK